MKATDFCAFFEFTLERGENTDEYGETFKYYAADDQGVFQDRHFNDVKELVDMFDSCLNDYIDEYVEDELGFEYDDEKDGSYYEQLLGFLKECKDEYNCHCHYEIVNALVHPETIVDDTI